MKRKIAFLVLVSSMAALLSLASSASAAIPFCLPGSGAGQCDVASGNRPQGVAVDTETGDVYVTDSGNNRVDVFNSDGSFVMAFGWGVDTGADELQTCTTASGCNAGIAGAGPGQFSAPSWVAVDNDPASSSRHDVYVGTDNFREQKFKPNGEFVASFGAEGTGPCQFSRSDDPIAVGPAGNVYVADSYEPMPNHFAYRLERFAPSGSCLGEVELFQSENAGAFVRNLAVDSGGNSYVAVAGFPGIRKYGPGGELLYELEGTETEGLAVDGSGDLFAKQRGQAITRLGNIFFITEYSAGGTVLKRFGYVATPSLNVPGLAFFHSAAGDIYATEGGGGVNYLALPEGPALVSEPCRVKEGGDGSASATLQAEVNPNGKATSFHFEYSNGTEMKDSAEIPLPGAADFNLHEAAFKVEGLQPETTYHCRIVAKNADGETKGEEGSFETREGFEFGPAWASQVAETSATVEVEGNPLGIEAMGQIEYVEDAKYQASGFEEALKVPAGEVDFGAGEEMQLRSVALSDLTPGTLYHYRLRIKNGTPPEGIICPRHRATCPELEHTLRTYLPEVSGFDDRGYELVSPGEKNSAEVAVPGNAGGFEEVRTVRIQASATSGEAVTYTSFTSFGFPEGAPGASQYLSRRSPAGWETENISPFGIANPVVPPYGGFSADLGFGALKVREPSLISECPEGAEDLYLRDNENGTLRCLTPEAPKSGGGCIIYAGASEDGGRAFFAANAAYAGAPEGAGTDFSLYEWTADGIKAVSILPGQSKAVSPTKNTSFGAGGGNCQVGEAIRRHVVSADGSRAIWTYVPEEPKPTSQLLDRIDGSKTIQLDALPVPPAKNAGAGAPGNGVFWAASTDGSVVYFTDTSRLVKGSKAEPGEPDLYRYEIGKDEPLSDLTRGVAPADVQGVVGASDDGSYIYFVAKGVLSEEENSAKEKAESGKDNLYLFHEGKTSFIARLAGEDEDDWESQPRNLSARVSPDGLHLAFLSTEAGKLADYENTVAEGEHCHYNSLTRELVGSPLCPQAFLYDAETKALSCASCNSAGTRPLGPTLLPGWTNLYEGPRYLSDNGSRFFFETYDRLLGADENHKRDVYEFERPGEGSCSAANANFDSASNGCHFLVSNGKSGDESYFVDASSNGRDVFISTRQPLVGWDVNENFDVYDYRAGGGFPEPAASPPACVGEGCKPTAPGQPAVSTPATSGFVGPGNAKAKKAKHHKKKHHKKKKHHSQKRRAGR